MKATQRGASRRHDKSCRMEPRESPNAEKAEDGQPEVLAECVMQPIRFAISKRDEGWRGKIEYHLYYGEPDPERDGGWAYEVDFLSFVMRR